MYQIIKFTLKIKEIYELPMDELTFICCDGEYIQTAPVFEDQAILDQLGRFNISVGKQPGSTTSINQPCDAWTLFLGWKTKLKNVNDKAVAYMIPHIQQIEKMFKNHNIWLNNSEERDLSSAKYKKNKNKIEMNPAHVKMAKTGLLRVSIAMNNTVKSQFSHNLYINLISNIS